MGFFSKKKDKDTSSVSNYFIKGAIVAGLMVIGSDSTVTEIELDMINSLLKSKGVPAFKVNEILSEITPKLSIMADKKNLLMEVSPFITLKEKQEIIRFCCHLVASDKKIAENEIKTIKFVAESWRIPDKSASFIIRNEIGKYK
jgi:hypothetical protein